MTLYWPALFAVWGAEPTAHTAWTFAVASLAVAALFVRLRSLGLARVHASAVALLVAIFPGADSTRLWPSMSAKVLAVTLALMRFSMALAAFRRNGRAAVLLHAGSLALYLASVLLYEVAFSMILAAGIGYIAFFGGRALRRWVIDIACIGAVLAFVTSGTFYDPLPIADMPEHARKVWRDAADHLRPWLAVAIESLVAAVASYGAIIPSPTLSPLATADRIGPTCLPPSILTVQPVLPKGATVFLSGKGSGRRPGGSRRGQ